MIKIHRSNEISNKMAEGVNIGTIDMSEIDAEFSDNLIKGSLEKLIDCLPNPEKIDFGSMLVIEGDFGTELEFTIPPDTSSLFLECYPGNIILK